MDIGQFLDCIALLVLQLMNSVPFIQEEARFGRIAEILVAEIPSIGTTNSVLIVDVFHVVDTLHAEIEMPLLLRVETGTNQTTQHVISPSVCVIMRFFKASVN